MAEVAHQPPFGQPRRGAERLIGNDPDPVVLRQSPNNLLGPFVQHLQLLGIASARLDNPAQLGVIRQFGDGCGNQARREFDRGFPQGGPDVLDRTALAMSFEAGGDLSQTGLGRRSLVDERVPEIEKSGRKAQKKMLTFLAKSTFWSRMILRSAIFHEPATRRSRSRRAPT